MRENPQTDKIELNFYLAKKFGIDLSERTYQRGLRELPHHGFGSVLRQVEAAALPGTLRIAEVDLYM